MKTIYKWRFVMYDALSKIGGLLLHASQKDMLAFLSCNQLLHNSTDEPRLGNCINAFNVYYTTQPQ